MPNIISFPHDKLVKKFLEDRGVAISFLETHLPSRILKNLDLLTVVPCSETAVSDEWKKYHSDVVFRCKKTGKEGRYVYILVEHQSVPDRFMPIRVLRYELNILGKYLDAKKRPKKLPNIVTIVLYHGKGKYPYPTDIASCFQNGKVTGRGLLEPMNLVDLASLSKKELKLYRKPDAVLKILLKYSNEINFVEEITEFMRDVPSIFRSLSRKQLKFTYEYVMFRAGGTKENEKLMKEAIKNTLGEEDAGQFFSLVDYYTLKGKESVAKEMLLEREPIERITKFTGLTRDELEEIAKA